MTDELKRIPSYSKIYSLGHREVKTLFDQPVQVEEKVDGSQFSFMRENGELHIRSKGATIDADAPPKLFAPSVKAVLEVCKQLRDGWTYRGEAFAKPKHNTLAYDRTPKNHVVIFDIDQGLQDYLSWEDKYAEATRLGFDCIPLLATWPAKSVTPETTVALLETNSFLGGQKIEGFVIKNYEQYDRSGKILMAKYVSERFKEIHHKDWKGRNPAQKDILTLIGEKHCTPARWDKAVQHLREDGTLLEDPKDIGALMKEVQRDVQEECSAEIAQELYKWAWKHIAKQLCTGLPQWYKDQLVAKQFESSDERQG